MRIEESTVVVAMAETAACVVAEETLEPSQREVAEKWSRVCVVRQVGHIAVAVMMMMGAEEG